MSDTQTMEGIKRNAPEGSTHYHVGLKNYMKQSHCSCDWTYTKNGDFWAPSSHGCSEFHNAVINGRIVLISNAPDDITNSMPFQMLEGDEDEGRKDDSAKPRFDLIPPRAQESMARVLTSGAARYGDNNWKQVRPLEQRYLAAAMRHLNALARGEVTDPDTGEHHGAHVMCCAAFLVEHHAIINETKS